MYIKTVVIISCLVLMGSCTPLKKSKSVEQTTTQTDNSANSKINTTELTSTNTEESNKKMWGEIVDAAENVEEYGNLDELVNEFTSDEESALKLGSSQHVASGDYNPLKDQDYIYFDLKKLKKDFHYPVDGKLISNYGIRSGRTHSGVDLKGARGDNVYAVFDGVVRLSKPYSGYGNVVVLRHNNGLETVYSHNAKNLVRVGQRVSSGDVIAKVGRTGRATTEHVHFEVRVAGQHVNPNALIDVENKTLQSGSLYIYKKGSKIYASNTRPSQIKSSDLKQYETYDREIELKNKESDNKKENAVTKKEESEKEVEKPTPPKVSVTTNAGAKYHSIVSGDTLSKLSRKYGTTVEDICKLNRGLKPTTVLHLKQKIRVK